MDIYEAINGRRSVRNFLQKEIPEEILFKIIEAACQAPSAGNIQPWLFYVVRQKKLKEELAMCAYGQSFIKEAPLVIVICADLELSARRYGERGWNLYAIQDTAAATENLLLAAYAEGLGTCWVGAFDEESVRQALDLPRGIRPLALVPVGYPAKFPAPMLKKGLEQVTTML